MKELAQNSKSLRLLYVEDNEETRAETLGVLENFFSDIEIAEDGEAGLNKFHEGTFDLIVSDLNMPKMGGLEMLRKIRQDAPDLSMIIVSAHNESTHFSDSIKIGVDGYLLKPLELQSFLITLQKVVSKISLEQENRNYKKLLENQNDQLICELEEKTKDLENKLMIDELTKLKSRYALFKILEEGKKEWKLPNIFLLNIDGFGLYNELYGIDVGNTILKLFSATLQDAFLPKGYQCYRLSGDEFVLLELSRHIDNHKNHETIHAILDLCTTQKFWIEEIDDEIELSVTIGYTSEMDNTLEKADMALKRAKNSLESYAIYHKNMDSQEDLEKILYWKKEIVNAINEDRITPVFQPIVNRNKEIVKYEALMRIKEGDDSDYRLIAPFHFLDIAHDTKLYDRLSYQMIKQSFNCMKDLPYSITLNINLSDLKHDALIELLKTRIHEYSNYEGKHITLEILEDDHIKDYDTLKSKLAELKSLGAKIAIDDFGSGYSNFSHILGISPDFVKIDGTLIKDIYHDKKSYQLVKAIVGFAKNLNMMTVAEFVEDENIFNVLKELGIDLFQGYYFSKPLEMREIQQEVSVFE